MVVRRHQSLKVKLLLFVSSFTIYQSTISQSLPVDYPFLDLMFRRDEITQPNLVYNKSFRSFQFITSDTNSFSFLPNVALNVFKGKKLSIYVLAPQQNIEYNSKFPFGWNNESMIRSRGLQSMTTVGFYIELGNIKLQIKPELIFSENKRYRGFYNESNPIYARRARSQFSNSIDYPEYFGNGNYTRATLGNSYIKYRLGKIDVGLSNEYMWWGPGRFNSLTMTNNASGFLHLTLQTNRPIKTIIGGINFQFIVGKLSPSHFSSFRSTDSTTLIRLTPKVDDWRYLSAFNISYTPSFFKGLEIGFIRTLQQYWQTTSMDDQYFPVLLSLSRKGVGGGGDEIDQQATLYTNIKFPKNRFELYTEFGRNDSPWNFRDFLMSPSHSMAWVVGFTKLFQLHQSTDLQYTFEWTNLARSGSSLLRAEPRWYQNRRIEHGYTNKGEVVGSGLMPGSNSIQNRVEIIRKSIVYGLAFDWIANDMDFFNSVIKPVNQNYDPWLNLCYGITFSRNFRNIIIHSELFWINSYNHQWSEIKSQDFQNVLISENKNNLFLKLKMAYKF